MKNKMKNSIIGTIQIICLVAYYHLTKNEPITIATAILCGSITLADAIESKK